MKILIVSVKEHLMAYHDFIFYLPITYTDTLTLSCSVKNMVKPWQYNILLKDPRNYCLIDDDQTLPKQFSEDVNNKIEVCPYKLA